MKLILSGIVFMMSLVCTASENQIVLVETNMGNFEIELFAEKAPLSVQNFLNYVDNKYYNDTIVHRVVKNFVIQAGGLSRELTEKPSDAPIKNEAGNGLSNLKGTVSLARTSEVDSATTHFFVNLKDNTRLDHKDETPEKFGYAVFGKVISGYEVIEKMEIVAVQNVGEYANVPVSPIVITNISRK